MKKNRASFFNDQIDYAQINSNVYNQNYTNPSMQPMQSANQMPQPNMSAQSSFYAGPNGQMASNNQMMMPGMMQMPVESNDIESRLAKLERQIQRIDHRLNKLENQNTFSTTDFDSNINDMYMV